MLPKEYTTLFNAITDAIRLLTAAQQAAEEAFLEAECCGNAQNNCTPRPEFAGVPQNSDIPLPKFAGFPQSSVPLTAGFCAIAQNNDMD